MIRPIFLITLMCLLSAQYQCESTENSKSKILVEGVKKLLSSSAISLAQFAFEKIKTISSNGDETPEYVLKLSADLQKVLTLDVQIFENSKEIIKFMKSGPERNLLAAKMDTITTLISKMRRNFDTYLDYKDHVTKSANVAAVVKSYAARTLDRGTSEVIRILGDIQDQIAVKNGNEYTTGVLPLMLSHLQDFSNLCNTNKSMNMILYDTYETIRNIQVVGNTIVLFAEEFLKMSEPSKDACDTFEQLKNSLNSTKNLIDKELIRIENSINAAFKSALQKASRTVETCSPISKFEEYKKWASLNDGIKGYGRIYINLEPVKSDVANSMVVTGARFARKLFLDFDGRTAVELCVEIQQGKLLDDGTIDAATLTWKDYSSSVAKPRRTGFTAGSTEFSLWAQDFHNISDGENPIVLTGFQLKEHISDRFALQIYGSPVVPPTSGSIKIVNKFIEAESFVIPEKPENGQFTHIEDAYDLNMNYTQPIQDLHLTQSSNLATGPADIINRYNHYVKFSKSKNAADKMLVPFIDLADAVTNPPVPLSGLGTYYKTTNGFSGSIGIELLTLSFESRIPDEIKRA